MSSKRFEIVLHPDQGKHPGCVVAREVFVPDGAEARDPDMPLAWLDEQFAETRLLGRGVEPRLAGLLKSIQETAAIKAVQEFTVSSKLFQVLAGGVGTGKTIAAAHVVAKWPESARLVKSTDLAKHGMYGETNVEFWDALAGTNLLVIDDLGTEPRDEKGYSVGLFTDLMDRRYDKERKTIITTNLGADRFKEIYCGGEGGRLLDRMRERGRFVNISGQSMRRPTA